MPPKVSSRAAVDFLLRGSLALAEIETAGVRVDMTYLTNTTAEVQRKINKVERKLYRDKTWKVWETKFKNKANLGSRDQLSTVLFKVMGFKPKTYTASSYEDDGSLKEDARASVDKSGLDHIPLPFVANYLKYENLKKTLSTYLIGLRQETVQHADGYWYVHPMYSLNTSASYRSGCGLINFQNQPKRNEEMANFVRRCFLPHPGHLMIDFDFSTLEVRIAYTYHNDPVMRKYLTDDSTDMHRDCAADLFGFPVKFLVENKDWAKKGIRDSAKNQFVFPEFYGSKFFQCAPNIWEAMTQKGWSVPGTEVVKKVKGKKVTREQLMTEWLEEELGVTELGACRPDEDAVKGTFEHHVKKVERKFWDRFKVYDQWRKDIYQSYLDKGYFELHTGFVIHSHHKRNDVINYGTQGAAFHCLLWCLIEMVDWLKRKKMRSRIIGEIHDSASISVHPKEVQEVIHKMHSLMTKELPAAWKWINIPLKIEVEVAGKNQPWNTQVPWQEKEGAWGPAA